MPRLRRSLALAALVSLPLVAGASAPPAAVVPYLQAVEETEATIAWLGEQQPAGTPVGPGGAAVTLTPEDPHAGPARTVRVSPGALKRARFTGLLPDTRFRYTVSENGADVASGAGRTWPLHLPASGLRFAVFGDSGSGNANQFAVAEQIRRFKPDFALHVGDVVYEKGEAEGYGPRYLKPYKPWIPTTPVYATFGNHDTRTEGGKPFMDFFATPGGGRYYAFTVADIQFFGLDTMEPFDAASPQGAWLKRELEASKAPWKVAFFHHPPYSSGMHGSSKDVRASWGPLFEAHDVQAVFAGHEHHYERIAPREDYVKDGTPTSYWIAGGGGAWVRPVRPQPFSVKTAVGYHFLGVTAKPDAMTVSAIDSEGRTFDVATVKRKGR